MNPRYICKHTMEFYTLVEFWSGRTEETINEHPSFCARYETMPPRTRMRRVNVVFRLESLGSC